MRIKALDIQNFRGIREAKLRFPNDSRIICLIGPGDSTKSTILQAIEYALWPNYNLNLFDADFYQCNTEEDILIDLTLTEIPESLLNEEKYGLYLRGDINASMDEPKDGEPPNLTIRLRVDSTLEPQWFVICNRKEPKPISSNDRKLLSFGKIGNNHEDDMTWGRNSVLQKYLNSKNEIKQNISKLFRSAASQASFPELDGINETIKQVADIFGVSLSTDISSQFSFRSSASLNSVGLFDGKSPLFQKGLGSQRLLSMGLQINATQDGVILLIDEIENGLEPYRLRSLINELRTQFTDKGQVFLTTHSHTTLVEMSVKELFIIHSSDGVTTGLTPIDGISKDDESMQSLIRSQPEAFLSKRVIVCEGKTEYGLLRALDNYLQKKEQFRIASKGVFFIEGNGSNYAKYAKQLKKMGFDVCTLVDCDRPCDKATIAEIEKEGIPVYRWNEGKSIEEQIFLDFDTKIINQFIILAEEHFPRKIEKVGKKVIYSSVYQSIHDELFPDKEYTPDFTYAVPENDPNTIEIKSKLGTAAKKHDWYKRIDFGERLGKIVFQYFDTLSADSGTRRVIEGLIKWVKNE